MKTLSARLLLAIFITFTFSLLVAAPALAEPPPGELQRLVETGSWKRAEKVWQRDLLQAARDDAEPDEAAWVRHMVELRAVIAAGREDALAADWYAWTVGFFGAEFDPAAAASYGRVGERLGSFFRPAPPAPSQAPDGLPPDLLRQTTKKKRAFLSPLYRAACKGETGSFSFKVSVEPDRRWRAPRPTSAGTTARPLCRLALLEKNRDQKMGQPGDLITVTERIEVVRQPH